MEVLSHWLAVVNESLNAPILVSVAVGLEFMFRMLKTEKPKSIVYMIADGIKKGGELLKKSGELLSKIGQILDKVLPQKLK